MDLVFVDDLECIDTFGLTDIFMLYLFLICHNGVLVKLDLVLGTDSPAIRGYIGITFQHYIRALP